MLPRASASFASFPGTKAVSDPHTSGSDTCRPDSDASTNAPHPAWHIAQQMVGEGLPRSHSAPLPTPSPYPLRATRTASAVNAQAGRDVIRHNWVAHNPVRAQINTLHSTLNLARVLSPAPIRHAHSAGRPDVLLIDHAPEGPGWALWQNVTPGLREAGLPLPPQRRVMVRLTSHAMADFAAALPWMQRSRQAGRLLADPLFSGAQREEVNAVLALLRLGLCAPADADRLIFDMAARATDAPAPAVPLTERLQLLAQVFEGSHRVGTLTRSTRTTPLREPDTYLSSRDAWGGTAHSIAQAAGNTDMLLALNAARQLTATPPSPCPAPPGRTDSNP